MELMSAAYGADAALEYIDIDEELFGIE